MSAESAIQAVLAANNGAGGIATLLTGGIYAKRNVGRTGINRRTTPAAYDTNGLLKPSAVVHGRDVVADDRLSDPETQYVSTRQVVEIWLYADGDTGFSTIRSAANRAFTLLHRRGISGAFEAQYRRRYEDNAEEAELNGAARIYMAFNVIAYQQGG